MIYSITLIYIYYNYTIDIFIFYIVRSVWSFGEMMICWIWNMMKMSIVY